MHLSVDFGCGKDEIRGMKADNILKLIGRTPVVRINKLFPSDYEVWAKLENFNPLSSIKDRIALAMVEDAEKQGLINKDTTIIEPTSGNTGIGLAFVCAVKGFNLTLVMPESMSIERRRAMAVFGAKLVLTPREKGMSGAIEQARALIAKTENSWMPMQFENPSNVEVHRRTTAMEILEDFPKGLDAIITGVGTGGHITACGEVLKEKMPGLKVFAVEPTLSPVLSGGSHSPHPIQGIGAGFKPAVLNMDVLDGTIQVEPPDAFEFARRAAVEEGLFIGISSGASLSAVNQKLPHLPKGSRVLTFCYDTGERYLSVANLFPEA